MISQANLNQLSKSFYNEVLSKMDGYRAETVRFGKLGKGMYPNYQTIGVGQHVRTYRGRTHRTYFEPGRSFKDKNLSAEFTYQQIASLAA